MQTLNLLRLHELTTDDRYRQRAERCLRAVAPRLGAAGATMSEMLLALDFYLDTPKEVVIVAPRSRQEAEPFLSHLRRTFLPNRILAIVTDEDLATQAQLIPLVAGKGAQGGKVTAYVCENRVCALPTGDPEVFARQIQQVRPLEPQPATGASP